mgnify:CR=1 FL=1
MPATFDVAELADRRIEMSDVFDGAAEIAAQLLGTEDDRAQVALLEELLLSRGPVEDPDATRARSIVAIAAAIWYVATGRVRL